MLTMTDDLSQVDHLSCFSSGVNVKKPSRRKARKSSPMKATLPLKAASKQQEEKEQQSTMNNNGYHPSERSTTSKCARS